MIDVIFVTLPVIIAGIVYLKLKKQATGAYSPVKEGYGEAYDPHQDPHKILKGEIESYFD